MNYIILSDAVCQKLQARYDELCTLYGYVLQFDAYLRNTLSFDGSFCMLNNRLCESEYAIIGKNCTMRVKEDSYYPNCLFAFQISFFMENERYQDRLRQTFVLPGSWLAITMEEAKRLKPYGTLDSAAILQKLGASRNEFAEFEQQWRTWDLYNRKMQEVEEKKELASELPVERFTVENDLVTLCFADWNPAYKPEQEVGVRFEKDRNKYFKRLGEIVSADPERYSIEVRCAHRELLLDCMDGSCGDITAVRIIDFGARARISRQRQALEKLFREDTANPNLKNILMGNYHFPPLEQKNEALTAAAGKFGSNVRQQEAYTKAVSAEDIYVIQGPPGTGKTTIITEIVKYAIQNNARVLVSSETNIAVDNVLERVRSTEQVLPVRLGREERISSSCLPYTLPNISGSILDETQRKLESLGKNSVSVETLLSASQEAYLQKRLKLQDAINSEMLQLPSGVDRELLYDRITRYERIVLETNKIYDGLAAEMRRFRECKENIQQLSVRQTALETRLGLAQWDGGHSHIRQDISVDLTALRHELARIRLQIRASQEALEKNRYETDSAAYNRKLRRGAKLRKELEALIGAGQPFMAYIRQVKEHITAIQRMENQLAQLAKEEAAERQSIRSEFAHKEELWKRSASIREEWRQLVYRREVQRDIEAVYMAQSNVVFATCTGFSSRENGIFSVMEYDYVIIDEAARCNSLDILIPLAAGKKIILVGDHKQLYPMIENDCLDDDFTKEQLQQIREHIIFKLLYEERVPQEYKVMLNRQYRMHPEICSFVSDEFYNGELLCEKEASSAHALVWIDSGDAEERVTENKSRVNQTEAQMVMDLLNALDRKHAKGTEVGVICIYKAQANLICGWLKDRSFKNIMPECSTVDAFQGKEKHTIILNLVVSRNINSFVSDANRINVAVSRAQEKLFIIGKTAAVKNGVQGALQDLYQYAASHGDVYNSRYVHAL